VLIGLAFLCGGLVSAAAFSIGWRHQAQHDTAAREALASATARKHELVQQVSTLRASLDTAREAEARAHAAAVAAQRALTAGAARIGTTATASSSSAASISAGAGSLTAASSRIAGELKTLDTYLTTTPAGEVDPGYVASQATYLTQQLTRLQTDAGDLGGTVASFETLARKLQREAKALKRP
jgi:Tfp pilus assembly protein FimV